MTGEYSREFSAKVSNGQSRLIELGFRQGGPAGYAWSFCALQAASERQSQQHRQCNGEADSGHTAARRGAQDQKSPKR